jgi:hypothetical protein
MKKLLALFALASIGCETLPDGTTRFDGQALASGATTVLDTMQRYQQIKDGWTVIGHDPVTGAPIYGYPPR